MRPLAVLILLVFGVPSYAGWQKIAQLEQKATCCFFFDDMTGLAGSGDYNGSDILKIWRTNDGGVTWLPCNVPIGAGQVTNIRMVSKFIGYASIFSSTNPEYSLWKTTDGGYSWVDNSKDNIGYTADVWVTPYAIIKTKWAGAPGGSTAGGRSLDGGNSFNSVFYKGPNENSNGIFFTSDDVGVVTAGPTTGVSWYTTDGGLNWNEGGALAEAWSAWGFAGSNIFFAVAELQRDLLWSTNGGKSWSRRYNFGAILQNNAITTGHISGKGSVIYVQTFGGGLLRTGANDSGRTWRPVGGPSNLVDSRAFYVGGCAGELVIAFDLDGSVWKTTDGGDGTLGGFKPLALEHIAFPSITACSTAAHFGTIVYGDCGEFVITSAVLENDPNGVFSLLPGTLPDTLTAGGVDTFFVTFDPRGNPATYAARIRVKGEIIKPAGRTPIDSVIRITASATPVVPKLTASLNVVSFGELSVCDSGLDTLITLKNEGCDTLMITSGPSSVSAPFSVEAFSLPLTLPPGSTTSFRVGYKPVTGGVFNASTHIQATSQGAQREIEILLDGSGRFGQGVLAISDPSFVFRTTSICATDSLGGFITNTGCDTLIVDSTVLGGDADFSVSAASLTKGAKLRPGDTLWFVIHLKPIQKGVRSGSFYVVLQNEHGSFASSIGNFTLTANVVDGTSAVSQSLVAIDFGTTDLCTERDSIFSLRNTGCDTVRLTDISIQGTGFELLGINLPLVLAPGESVDVRLQTKVDTTGGKVQSTAIVTFVSTATNPITPIQLKRSYSFPRSYRVSLRMDQTEGTSGNVVRLAVIGEQGLGFAGTGVHTLDATLTLNEDLLHYLSAEGPNTLTRSGSAITISHPQELQATPSGSLADLIYEVYLTKDSTTDIVISGLRINGGDTSACATQILGSGSLGNGEPAFTYTYRCGDHTIQKFLETGRPPLDIISIRPNPASEEVTIEIASQSKDIVKAEIYNEAGDLIAQYDRMPANITLPVAGLAEGSYTVRIDQAGTSASARFVVVK